MFKIKKVKNVTIHKAIVGSAAGDIDTADMKSAAIYAGIASAAMILTALITTFMPFLKLDATIVETKFMIITPGNFVTVFLTFLGVVAKKFGQDRSNIFIEEKPEVKPEETVGKK